MSTKNSRSGGKFSGNHTTLTPIAAQVCDIANKCAAVHNISPGFLRAGLPSVNGKRRVKLTDKKGGILLAIRDNTSHQEVYIYADDVQEAKLSIAQGCRNLGLGISFS